MDSGWKMEDFFWSHTQMVGEEEVAFVHIDTSYLAYGRTGESGNKYMKDYFEKYGWSDDEVLAKIEKLLEANRDATYKIAVGHHPIGATAGYYFSLTKLEKLFYRYRFQSYFCGHTHALGYFSKNKIAYYLSGAGGNIGGAHGGSQ